MWFACHCGTRISLDLTVGLIRLIKAPSTAPYGVYGENGRQAKTHVVIGLGHDVMTLNHCLPRIVVIFPDELSE